MANNIRPVSDLRNHFAEISNYVHATGEPVFLTKNGYGDMVVMSMEAYEQNKFDSVVYDKLAMAESVAENNGTTYSAKDVLKSIKEKIESLQDVQD